MLKIAKFLVKFRFLSIWGDKFFLCYLHVYVFNLKMQVFHLQKW